MKMEKEELVVGDIILIKNGYNVNISNVPSKYFITNRRFSSETNNHDIEIGHLYRVDTDITAILKSISMGIMNTFDYEGIKIPITDVVQFAKDHINLPPSTETFIVEGGKFLIVSTNMEGGGIAMFHDHYPDSLRIYCKRLNDDGTYNPDGQEIKFYYKSHIHSGGIDETIIPIGKLEKLVTFK